MNIKIEISSNVSKEEVLIFLETDVIKKIRQGIYVGAIDIDGKKFRYSYNQYDKRDQEYIDKKIKIAISEIEKRLGISLINIRSKSRFIDIRDARNLLMYLMYRVIGKTSTSTGKFLYRNHATILSGSKRTEHWMEFDIKYREMVLDIISIINEKK